MFDCGRLCPCLLLLLLLLLQVDVFVMVADAQGLILDSRDYLAPLVTPWEAAIALSGRWGWGTGRKGDTLHRPRV